ncbi:MAG TPA: von Willebrand factor type A domain-containing protein [Bacteroidales bacterium]|nr:von Willebrand factor type A domain-containing protein [Bacteroidales bacterium]HPE23686.1 von Willebrand factor type A domain-containing protein [Bacteroidales bacterium]HPJ06293.1 von Willebrand factor type A domain-containing protein [Bacteroidales bacterium]HPQ64961.1 von Willebrand factor type A domain-containing protein [Bacteroidales bacterium]HRW27762.1 von Willebrand factor type A domain-containing protein [Bacteroidales bacterium]
MKTLLSIIAFMLVTALGPATQVAIKGTVTDGSGNPLSGVVVMVKGTNITAMTGVDGTYAITISQEAKILLFSLRGMKPLEELISGRTLINVTMEPDNTADIERKPDDPVIPDKDKEEKRVDEVLYYVVEEDVICESADAAVYDRHVAAPAGAQMKSAYYRHPHPVPQNTESYTGISENGYRDPLQEPYSTFSIDVDNASYSNVRRFINLGQEVPADAVRIEEMINYFRYDYPQPSGEHPFSVYTEAGICPWNNNHYLLHIGLRGKDIDRSELPPSNLVFLIDVSGSMNYPNKLPLLKSAFSLLINEQRETDRVAMVVYAGAAGVVLESTPGNRKETIMQALDNLQAGGSTAGGAGLMLAYKIAEKNFIKEGNNRIILATDGDFNVGVSDNASMEKLVEQKRGLGIYMTVLGFGMGNIKDDKMEIIADKGNGNYAYIDNIQEARRVLVQEFGGTLFTIAKDVKFQIEFNPAYVKAYRLVGYENRLLADRDFNDDTKDAGEMGAGHTVTALYEIVPAGSDETGLPTVDPLRYQGKGVAGDVAGKGSGSGEPAASGYYDYRTESRPSDERYPALKDAPRELCNIKLRYKDPDALTSKLFSKTVDTDIKKAGETTDRFRFSAAVAEFGMILRDSKFRGTSTVEDVVSLASGARGTDPDGYRAEFIRLVQSAK